MKKNTRTVLTVAAVASAVAVAYVVYKRRQAAAAAPQSSVVYNPPPTTPAVYTPPSSPSPADIYPPTDPLEISIGGIGGVFAAERAASSHAFETPGEPVVKGQPFLAMGEIGSFGYDGYDNMPGIMG